MRKIVIKATVQSFSGSGYDSGRRLVVAMDALLRFCRLWRTGAEAVPKKVAARIAKTKDKKEIRDILTEALNGLLPAIKGPLNEYLGDANK